MRTELVTLRIGKADGTVEQVPMRFNGSHQRGYRCYIGELATESVRITEETPRSFEGRRLFDALAQYRRAIEPDGWRLFHAVARTDCWPKPQELMPVVQVLTSGQETTLPVNGFQAAAFEEVGSLDEQREAFDRWIASLPPVYEGRVRPRAGHEHDEAAVEFGPLSRFAGKILFHPEN